MEKIKVTYEHLGKREFLQFIGRMRRTKTSFDTVSFFYHFTKAIEKGLTEMQSDYQSTIAKEYGVHDDKGELVMFDEPTPDNPSRFKLKEGTTEKFKEAEEAFGQKKVELDIKPAKLSRFKTVGDISVDELVVLEPFVIPESIA